MTRVAAPSDSIIAPPRVGDAPKTMPAEWLVPLAAVLMGLFYLCLVRPGIPYDEPSHFRNIQYYAHFHRLPVLDSPRVTYEAYHPLVYYLLGALVYHAVSVFGVPAAFYALRFASLLLMVPVVLLTMRIAGCAFPGRPVVGVTAGLFLALNPNLLAVAASIQNDMLAILLALVVLWIAIRRLSGPRPLTAREEAILGIQLGVLVALALLTKLTDLFFVAALPLYALRVRGRRSLPFIGAFLLMVLAGTGWWFVRNLVLYGDLIGESAIRHYYPAAAPPPLHLLHPFDMVIFVRSVVTYLWLPVEYFRNMITAPVWMRAAVVAVTVLAAGAAGVWLRSASSDALPREARRALGLLLFCGATCFGIYMANSFTSSMVPARMILPVIILPALALGGLAAVCARRLRCSPWLFTAGLSLLLLAMNATMLHRVSLVHNSAFHLF